MTTIADVGTAGSRSGADPGRERGAITAARGSRPGAWSRLVSWSCASGAG